jgi:small subunit ribosomal protein S2
MIDFKELAKAGVHFGHQTSRWNPKMAPYIWGSRSGIHLIDVSKTASQMEKAAKFLEEIAAQGKQILWVGTKKQAQGAVKDAAEIKMPMVTHRWIGGTLTNNSQVRKSITRMLHFEDILDKSEQTQYKKKELGTFKKIVDRLQQNVGGIKTLRWPVGAVVIVDVRKEQTALKEAVVMGVPVVALVDTNSDPSFVTFPIPANDDSPKAIKVVVDYLIAAVKKGLDTAAQKKVQIAQAKEEKQEALEAAPEITSLQEEEEDEGTSKAKATKVAKKPAPRTKR